MMVHEGEVPTPSGGNVGRIKKAAMCSSECLETVVLGVAIVVLWGLLALPTVFYHLPQVYSNLDTRIKWHCLI